MVEIEDILKDFGKMKYIEIDKNILVNPDSVDALELTKFKNKEVLYIWVNGRRFTATANPQEILRQLNRLDETKQYWAGK